MFTTEHARTIAAMVDDPRTQNIALATVIEYARRIDWTLKFHSQKQQQQLAALIEPVNRLTQRARIIAIRGGRLDQATAFQVSHDKTHCESVDCSEPASARDRRRQGPQSAREPAR